MYRGFNLTLKKTDKQRFMNINDDEIERFNNKLEIQKELIKSKMESAVETNVDNEGNIDGTQLTNEWFPSIDADVFISHSHDDLRTVQRLAIWLEKEFNLTSFVDSAVWGSADELLKEIDNKYSVLKKSEEKTTYRYETRNFTTAHVHMMLSTALMEMIDTSECIIFLNTPNSIKLSDYKERKTRSPWIYNELKVANVIRKDSPIRHSKLEYKDLLESERVLKHFADLQIDYDISEELRKFVRLTGEDLIQWEEKHAEFFNINNLHALDILYSLKPQTN